MRTIAIIGVPGAGKTEVVRGVLEQFTQGFSHDLIVGKRVPDRPTYLLGVYRGHDFDGTDQLSFTAVKSFREWLPTLPPESIVLFEGDRLANDKVLQFCRLYGTVHIVLVDADADRLAMRRKKREKLVGKPQDPTWLAGRTSKVSRLCAQWMGYVMRWPNNTQADLAKNQAKLNALLEEVT